MMYQNPFTTLLFKHICSCSPALLIFEIKALCACNKGHAIRHHNMHVFKLHPHVCSAQNHPPALQHLHGLGI